MCLFEHNEGVCSNVCSAARQAWAQQRLVQQCMQCAAVHAACRAEGKRLCCACVFWSAARRGQNWTGFKAISRIGQDLKQLGCVRGRRVGAYGGACEGCV